ncbi:MAG: hypothetical protein RL662_1429 [Bacteroidota bacterium]|jgi:hypothetical protein
MKKIGIYILAGCLSLSSCVENFLENDPKNLQTEDVAFVTSDNFQTYAWGLYDVFGPKKGEDVNFYQWDKDIESGLMVNNNSWNTTNNIWAYQKMEESTRNSNWDFFYIRRVNTMLDNIDLSSMSDVDKKHWRSVGYFFRAYRYIQLLSAYGDVPWIEAPLKESDTEMIYGARDSRDVVAKKILDDLQYAETNIIAKGNGANSVNLNVVKALISRFGLFEGTWRKYHGLPDSKTYLDACIKSSEELIASVPDIHPYYNDLFNSQSLAGTKGILLYREYADGVMSHQACRQAGSSGNGYELTKKMVDLYLCADGKPISSSPLFKGEKDAFDEFKNRDIRLHFTVLPPFRVKNKSSKDFDWKYYSPTAGDTYKIGSTTYTVTVADSLKFRENIDIIAEHTSVGKKELPTLAWNRSIIGNYAPRFMANNEGYAPTSAYHGYWLWKYYNVNIAPATQGQNDTDLALFRIEETMLNYAEATCEQGAFTQEIANLTINKLRVRGKVAAMKVSDINDSFDPKRDQTVSALLWEVRRERHVELIAESFACDDIRRWKKGEYLNERPKGRWIKNSDHNNKLTILGYADAVASANKEGYSVRQFEPKGWKEHYYLDPVPMKDLVLNPKLKQNRGYKDPNTGGE